MRLSAFSLLLGLLFGLSSADCGFKMPNSGKCQQDIIWRTYNDHQALATCFDYFPTTFITAERLDSTDLIMAAGSNATSSKVRCTVTAAYRCIKADHIPMFDKCYYFPQDAATKRYIDGTIADYSDETKKLCDGGKMSIFYSNNHAKFVAMEAHRRGINKLWIAIKRDGKSIENGMLIHKKMWKLDEDDCWDGTTLMKKEHCSNANYLFLRTRTDYELNRQQGTFELATANTKATFACEFEAKFATNQEWYCNKMATLSMDTVYDGATGRCLYVSATSYSFGGTNGDLSNIGACQERPSELHSNGLDDGTGDKALYNKFKYKGTLRLAGYMDEQSIKHGQYKSNVAVQKKCSGPEKDSSKLASLRQKWRLLKHHGKMKYTFESKLEWNDGYPLNECSDFNGNAITLGVKNGAFVDIPKEARLNAVCSIIFFQECENTAKKQPCGTQKECKNTNEFQSSTDGFFTCKCPETHTEQGPNPKDLCKWDGDAKYACAWMKFFATDTSLDHYLKMDGDGKGGVKPQFLNFLKYLHFREALNDNLKEIIVRDGCTVHVWSHAEENDRFNTNFQLLSSAGYGTHIVPNKFAGTLGGVWAGMSASAVECNCTSPARP